MNKTGKEIQQVLYLCGVPCSLQLTTTNDLVEKFEFNLSNLTDYDKIGKAVEILKVCYHKNIEQVKSNYFHFALQVRKDTTQTKSQDDFDASNRLAVPLGLDDDGQKVEFDLQKAVHTLIAGSTGMGKTNIINNIIYGLAKQNTADQLQFYLIDVKRTLTMWKKLPNVKKVATDGIEAINLLNDICNLIDKRFKVLEKREESKAGIDEFPQIVVIVDEFADLMLTSCWRKQTEGLLTHIAQLGRAVNISLILATQNPLAKVCTSLIKSNCPTRIALKTASIVDSRVILDNKKAFELQGVGNAIMRYVGGEFKIKTFFLDDEKIKEFVKGENK